MAKVLVVGAGPVGLIVAAELAKYQVEHDIVEANPLKDSYSKALSVSAASLKAFHGLGLADEFSKIGKAIRDVEVYYNNKRCARIDKKYLQSCYKYYLSLPQPDTEAVIERKLQSLGGGVQYGVKLIDFAQSADSVLVTLERVNGERWQAEYDFVLGCDGTQSAVRQQLGLRQSEQDYKSHFIMGDVFFETPRSATTSYHVYDDGFLIYLPMAGDLTRLVVGRQEPLSDERPKPSASELQIYLDRYYPEKLKIVELVWSSCTRFFNRLSESTGSGRVYLAGDSFHQVSPIGGQGMNTGVQDAMNLAWKIALTVKGNAKPALLDSYRDERYEAVKKVMNSIHRNTSRILRRSEPGLSTDNFEVRFGNRQAYRDALPREFGGFVGEHYDDPAFLVGRHVPYCKLDEGNADTTYDIPQLKKNVAIVAKSCNEDLTPLLRRYSDVLSTATLKREDPSDADPLGLGRNGDICLVRPDGFIGFQGSIGELQGYLDRLYV